MKTMAHSKIAALTLALASTFAATGAFADYRVAAFSDTLGFRALLKEDMAVIEKTFAARDVERMDFFEINNLCVAQILMDEFDAAVSSCSKALEKADYSSELTVEGEKIALAAIYSNLAIARVMSGDSAGASAALEASLSLNEKDSNASMNYDAIKTNLVAGD